MENAKKFFEEIVKTEEAKALFLAIEAPQTEEARTAAYIDIAKKLGVELIASVVIPAIFLLLEGIRTSGVHIYVFNAAILEARIENLLNVLPDGVAVRANDHTALYAGVINEVGLLYDVRVPFCKILVHRGNLLNKFFVVCHFRCPFIF